MNVLIFGGNGFVGTHVAKNLQQQNCTVSCVSRSGSKPNHLQNEHWASQVKWIRGNALTPDEDLLGQQDVLVSLVGAPPLPTLGKKGYQLALTTNGQANVTAIESAANSGIKRVVLLGAKIPRPLNRDWFAYAKGKQMATEAAMSFAKISTEHSAVLIQPGGLYGKRYTKGGRQIPLDWVLGPIAKLVPSQLISIELLAQCIADAAVGLRATETGFSMITHGEI